MKQRTSAQAGAKFKAEMGAYVASVTPARAVRRPSGSGPGIAKARAGFAVMGERIAAQQSAGKAVRRPSGTGPGAAKFRTAMTKYLGSL
jgi:hypothetical protein